MKTHLLLAAAGLSLCASPILAKPAGNQNQPNAGQGQNNGNGGNGNGNAGGNGNGGGNAGQAAAPRACALSDLGPGATACTGFIAGNLLSGSGAGIAAQKSALQGLGLAWDGDFSGVTKINSLNGSTVVGFAAADQNPLATMFGDTWVGIHFGAGAGLGGQVTGFWKLDAGTAGLGAFALNILQGSSGAVLYRTGLAPIVTPPVVPPVAAPPGLPGGVSAVPEPATWAMLILGFGMVGVSLRRRPGVASVLA